MFDLYSRALSVFNFISKKSKHIIQKCLADIGTGITDVIGGCVDHKNVVVLEALRRSLAGQT
jgi:hypothetical protein